MRNTKQKELIFNIISSSYNHPTAFEIYQEAKKEIPNISLGTIYRNLNLLVEQNKIRKLQEDTSRFDKKENHSHFVCFKCGKIIDIYEDYLEKKEIDGNIVMNYEMRGICKDCFKKES